MQPLSAALQKIRPDTQHSESSPDPGELRDLEPTAVIRKALERLQAQVESLPEDAGEGLRNRGKIAVDAATEKLARAAQRDAIKATRPDGCWCFGLGGRGSRYIPNPDGDPIEVFDTYCTCSDGTTREAADGVERAHYAATRRQYRAAALFQQAQVPPRFERCTFETFPLSAQTRPGFAAIRQWVDDGRESLLIYGPYGTGKTGLAVAALRSRVQQTQTDALFLTTPALLDRIRSTYEPRRRSDEADATESDVLDVVRHCGLLVLDDLGAERPTEWVVEKLFTIINFRHDELLPTVFTSNLDPEGLAKHLGERIAWRIVEMCTVVKLDGPNLRDRKDA